MSKLLAVGGRQAAAMSSKQLRTGIGGRYSEAVALSVDTESGEVSSCLRYVSPPEYVPSEQPSVLFKSAHLEGDTLYVPTTTEVMVYKFPSFRCVRHESLPCFNDLHHVRPSPGGNLIVANTGLDMVLEIAPDGLVVEEWPSLDEDLWSRFSRDVDYRLVPSTQPHASHPNFTYFVDGDLWVTRCNQYDTRCLSRDLAPIPIADRPIHDGLVRGDRVYFTVVDGVIVVVDTTSLEVVERIDLNEFSKRDVPLGWCRGLDFLDDDRVVVGFSRLRPTKWRDNVSWVKDRLRGGTAEAKTTRIAIYDLRSRCLVSEVDLEPHGIDAVFSVLVLPD
jgi:hypothetical protein